MRQILAAMALAASADFEVIDGTSGVIITKYIGRDVAVEIPPQINDRPVTVIADRAFRDAGLTSVVIPESIASIGDEAFAHNHLVRVIIPARAAFIGILAFAGNQLTSVVIPEGVVSISEYAFARNRLEGVVIPNTTTSIGSGAFSGNQLAHIVIGANVRLGGYALNEQFEYFYSENGNQAGTYILHNSEWNFKR
ncbi:MAG: leucine-rich repeat domain-containing protein [Treponema sp.]|jgi:hypothetical protein|nr:leucine-rich repeat domain-containing protein [Treponema sp.]